MLPIKVGEKNCFHLLHWATESEKYIILTLFYDQNYVNLSNLKFQPLCHTKSSFFFKSPIYWNRMLANLKIICQFHAHSVYQNSVEIFRAEIYRGRLFFRAEIYRGQLLTLITGSSSRLLRIRFSADLTMYWFPVYHFRCMKFKPLVIWKILLFLP